MCILIERINYDTVVISIHNWKIFLSILIWICHKFDDDKTYPLADLTYVLKKYHYKDTDITGKFLSDFEREILLACNHNIFVTVEQFIDFVSKLM